MPGKLIDYIAIIDIIIIKKDGTTEIADLPPENIQAETDIEALEKATVICEILDAIQNNNPNPADKQFISKKYVRLLSLRNQSNKRLVDTQGFNTYYGPE